MLEVVCWLWRPAKEYRSQFTVDNVNILRRMVARHYSHPHRFNCITDQTEGFDPEIRVIPLWSDYESMESIYGPNTPSCYRRLRAFSSEMEVIIGPRFVSVDLDTLILDDLSSVWNRPEDFVIWGATARRTPWNGSMWMMNAGAREKVWTEFKRDPERAITKARGAGFYGSDQAWMNYVLGPKENHWNEAHGVYSYRMHVKPNKFQPPAGAKIIFFEGHYDPWHPQVQEKCPWVVQEYR